MKHYNTFFVSLLLRNTPSSWKWFDFIFFPDCDFLCSCSLILRLFRHLNRSLLQPFVCSLFPYLFRLARLLRQKFPHTNQCLVKIWPLKNVYLNYAKHTQNTESAIFPVLPVCVLQEREGDCKSRLWVDGRLRPNSWIRFSFFFCPFLVFYCVAFRCCCCCCCCLLSFSLSAFVPPSFNLFCYSDGFFLHHRHTTVRSIYELYQW